VVGFRRELLGRQLDGRRLTLLFWLEGGQKAWSV
jgi:hypothetical protein